MAINNRFILSSTGDFRTYDTFNNYVLELTNFISGSSDNKNIQGTTLEVRGPNDFTRSNYDPIYNTTVHIEGNDGTLTFVDGINIGNIHFSNINIVVNGEVSLINDITFDNCNITVNSSNGFIIKGNNITFNNCNIIYNYNAVLDGSFVSTQLSNISNACILAQPDSTVSNTSNINITNCIFTTPYLNHFPFISFILAYQYTTFYDINISNNQFICSDTSSEDKRSVIALTSTQLTLSYFSRLINTNISNNICNSSQLISISPTINGSNDVASAITCINTNISNNTCGAICFFSIEKKAQLPPTDPFLVFYNSSLYIKNNNCRFIYSGFSSGFINKGSNVGMQAINSTSNIVSGTVVISENVCSWIQTGIRNFGTVGVQPHPSTICSLTIKDNKLIAYNPTYLNSYYDTLTAINTAIIVNNVLGE